MTTNHKGQFECWRSSIRAARVIGWFVLITFFILLQQSFSATLYWDGNGATTGAGTTPSGTWGTSTFWTTSAAGTATTANTATTAADILTFSTGTDATGSYTINVNNIQTARQISLKYGTTTFTGGTINLSSLSNSTASNASPGIILQTGSGSSTISSNITINGLQTFNVASGLTLNLNTGTFTRNAGSFLNVQGSGSVVSTQSGLSSASLVNGIVGPWTSFGTGTSTKYATIDGTNKIVGLTGTSAATAAAVTSTTGLLNYDVAGTSATFGAGASVNTLRFTGGGGTMSGNLTTNGLMHAGTGTTTLSGTITIGSNRELVVSPSNNSFIVSGVIRDNAGGASSLFVAQSATSSVLGLTLNNANTYSGGTTIANSLVSITNGSALGTGAVTVLKGTPGTVGDYGSQLAVSNNISWANDMTLAGQGYNGYTGALLSSGGNNTSTGTITISDLMTRISSTSGSLTINGAINLAAGSYNNLFQHNGGDIYIGGTITGATTIGVLSSTTGAGGSNYLIFNRANALATPMGLYLGSATVAAYGRVDLNGFDQTITTITAAGTDVTQNVVTNRSSTLATLTINASTTFGTTTTYAGNLALTKTGSGTITINGNNTYSGGTNVNVGRIDISLSSSFGTGNVTIASGALVGFQTAGTISNNFTIAGTGGANGAIQAYAGTTVSGLVTLSANAIIATRTNLGNSTFTLTGGITSNGINRTLTLNTFNSASIANNQLTISTKSVNLGTGGTLDIGHGIQTGGTGIFNLNVGNNTWGTTIVRGSSTAGVSTNATLNLGAVDALGSSNSVLQLGNSNTAFEGIVVNLNGNNQTIGGLRSFAGSGSASINGTRTITSTAAATLTINNSSATNYLFDGSIAGNISLVKNGSAMQTLTGGNTYTGSTTINVGTLQISSTTALGGTSKIDINGGSLLVSANQNLNSTNVNLNGGTLAFSGTTTNYFGVLTLTADSSIDFGIGSALAYFSDIRGLDQYRLKIYNWTSVPLFEGGYGGGTDRIVSQTSLSSSDLQKISFYSGFDESSFTGSGFQVMGGSFDKEVIGTPEPETYLIAALLLGGLLFKLRRRKSISNAP